MSKSSTTNTRATKKQGGITRRALLASSAAGTAAAALLPNRLWAADAEHVIRVGYISPRSGQLGTFGEGDEYLLGIVRNAIKNGLTVNDKTYKIEIIDRDSQSDPARAAQLAKKLINEDNIDFMLGASTPEVVNPVADACEAGGVPCLSTVTPWEVWYFGRGAKPGQPSPFKWTYHFSFGVGELARMYPSIWNSIPTNKRVGIMYPNDADGNAIRGLLPPTFEKAGFTVVDPGVYEDGTTDYTTQIAKLKKEQCEIVNVICLPPDFATFWRQAAQQGYSKMVKITSPAKAGATLAEIEALGDLGNKIAGDVPWHKTFPYVSPLTKMSSMALNDGYQAASGRQASQELGATLAIFDAGIEALKTTSNPKDKATLAKTLSDLKVITTVGLVDFNDSPIPHVIATTPLLGTQWRKTPPGSKFKYEQVVVENINDPKVSVGEKLVPYNR